MFFSSHLKLKNNPSGGIPWTHRKSKIRVTRASENIGENIVVDSPGTGGPLAVGTEGGVEKKAKNFTLVGGGVL